MIRAVVVDDEAIARSRLRRLLTSVSGSSLDVIAECVSVDELLEVSCTEPIDVVFLDVEMPGGDGFSALYQWSGRRPLIVFVTGSDAHGMRAFDVGAVDYLLKPVSAERLRESLERVRKALGVVLSSADHEMSDDRRIPLQIGRRTCLVSEREIVLVKASRNYVEVETEQGTFIVRRTLTAFSNELTEGGFIQLQRSVIVRRDAIKFICSSGSGKYRVGLHGGREVSSGRQFQQSVRDLLRSNDFRRDALKSGGQER